MSMASSSREIVSSRLIVGLEIHVELATRRKMFSRAPSPAISEFADAPPNTLIDPVVLGLPGALPVMNKAAVELSMLVGMALGCSISRYAVWDRKSYFYPDMPKNYQISQYQLPLCFDGGVELPAVDERGQFDLAAAPARIGIIRAHLEEDAGKLMHEAPGGHAIDHSIVDLNRSGAALLEIVTQPDFTSAEQVVAFAKLLRNICRSLGATEGVMQRGHMRFEPNINCELELSDGHVVRTPVVEVKNLNSFKSLRGAIDYEFAQQPHRWRDDGRTMGPGAKVTRGWDDGRGATYVMREKEDAHDYRYLPDPDLAPVAVDPAWEEQVRARLTELPLDRLRRYVGVFGLSASEGTALVEEHQTAAKFESIVEELGHWAVEHARAGRLAANLLLQSGLKRANEKGVPLHELHIGARSAAQIAALREAGKITSASAEALFNELCEHPGDGDVEAMAQARGMLIVHDDSALDAWADQAIAANPKSVADVQAGKTAAAGRIVGDAMKLAAGRADAKSLRARILHKLGVKE